MASRWDAERVLTLAPDRSARQAAGQLTGTRAWTGTGGHGEVLWGLCAGSGKEPYQTIVDLSGPAYKCSCPSRKFPCKHALALLLNWANGLVPEVGAPADFATAWIAGRAARAGAAAARAGAGAGSAANPAAGPGDPAAAGRRASQRRSRVSAGLAELELWLGDQIRSGLSGASAGYAHFEPIAARMVDAQAPAVASTLRSLAAIPASGADWPARLLDAYAQLHLLAIAHGQLDSLEAGLAATVRSHVGYPVSQEIVLASPAVIDQWLVTGGRDIADAAIPARRVWLRGQRTGRRALLLFFDPRGWFGGIPDATLTPGTVVEADLRFYPGTPPLRAIVAARRSEPRPAGQPAPDGSLADAMTDWATALAADPWLLAWPVTLSGVPVPADGGWMLADTEGQAVPLVTTAAQAWPLLSISGGAPVTVAGEWTADGLRPLTAWHGDQAVRL